MVLLRSTAADLVLRRRIGVTQVAFVYSFGPIRTWIARPMSIVENTVNGFVTGHLRTPAPSLVQASRTASGRGRGDRGADRPDLAWATSREYPQKRRWSLRFKRVDHFVDQQVEPRRRQ